MTGDAGLGKTHLALSIAGVVLARGFNVLYVSSQSAFGVVEKDRFDDGGETLQAMLEAELLILDDLGTEYLTPYVASCIYRLVDTRLTARRPTIYTSNIQTQKTLNARYTEKVGQPAVRRLRDPALLGRRPAPGKKAGHSGAIKEATAKKPARR